MRSSQLRRLHICVIFHSIFLRNTCSACNSGYYWQISTYMNNLSSSSQYGTCLPCPAGCLTCSNNFTCLTCSNGYYQVTPTSGANYCASCSTQIANCTSCQNAASCISCAPNYTLVNNACITCPSNCANCNNSNTCIACTSPFILNTSNN